MAVCDGGCGRATPVQKQLVSNAKSSGVRYYSSTSCVGSNDPYYGLSLDEGQLEAVRAAEKLTGSRLDCYFPVQSVNRIDTYSMDYMDCIMSAPKKLYKAFVLDIIAAAVERGAAALGKKVVGASVSWIAVGFTIYEVGDVVFGERDKYGAVYEIKTGGYDFGTYLGKSKNYYYEGSIVVGQNSNGGEWELYHHNKGTIVVP